MTSTHKLHEDDLLQLRADEFTQRYKVVSKLGSGAFADVLRVKDLRGGRDCAVKVLRPAAAHPAGLQPEVALFREARALKHAKHPNIVGLVSVLRVPALGSIGLSKRSSILRGLPGEGSGSSRSSGSSSQHGSCWGLMLEYVQDGSLAQVLYKQMVNPFPRAYSDTAALTWAVDLASAVAHLHGLSPCIIHRDLKLENILMQKPEAQPAAPAGRKLPLAKISDFGLHVMLETPPCPYLITSNGGCPVLLFGPELQQLQQQQQQDGTDAGKACSAAQSSSAAASVSAGSAASGSFTAEVAAFAGDSCSEPQLLLLQKPCSSCCGSCNSSSSSSSKAANDAVAAADGGTAGTATGKPPQQPAVRRLAKHVAFSASTRSLYAAQNDPPDAADADNAAAVSDQARAAANDAAAARSAFRARASLETNSDPLPQLQLPRATAQQRQEWQPLTTSALRRMSLDSMASSGPGCGIPLALQLQGGGSSSRPGSAAGSTAAAGFARVSVPMSALQRGSPSSAAAAAGGDCGSDSGVGFRAVGVAGGECYDDVTDILAAANMERDYEVSMSEAHDRAASSSSWSRAPSVASSLHAGSSSRPPTPKSVRANTAAAAAAAAAGGVDHLTLADVGSISGRCWDGVPATTAASMLWEDMMEDDDCQELLDGPGHPGCASGLLAYDLTQHTGSYMYMAPEIYRGEPYNESVDVFSLGVILYELFSRSLLLYTQTPASKPSDTEAYAARVAGGFRPPRPVNMHAGVWGVIERCWAADPTARPAAAWVLQQLQQLLQAEEAAAAAAERRKSSSGIAGAISKLRGAGRRSMDAYAAARLERRGGSTIDEDAATGAVAAAHGLVAADASNVDDSGAAAGAGSAGAAGDSGDGKATVVAVAACTGAESLQDKPAPAACSAAGIAAGSGTAMRKPHGKKAEPACGCVIC
uniref:Protein kinase domain-containing protein n=1 Tax=Tetradesmus obliquus TaxID=3088 RepID=A0A383VJ07_TETOB|eukprot:jgi/Sobl393_1/5973/SZX65508.1